MIMSYEIRSCYIAAMICNKLNLSDDCEVLNTLRDFKNNVMQRDYKYCVLLFESDIIEPKIAKMINDDKDTEYETWQMIYNCYLLQTANLIEGGKYDQAVFMYKRMINVLKDHYRINESIDEIIMNFDFTQGGHGRVKLIERARGI